MSNSSGAPTDRASWDERYVDKTPHWDSGVPDSHLLKVVEEFAVEPGKAIDVGCGTGTNAIWLAQNGFEVTGVDLAPTAVAKARSKVAAAGVRCHILCVDFLKEPVPGGPFGFAYDRGCMHSFDQDALRMRFVEHLAALTRPDAIWLSLIGSTDGPPRKDGPPRRSAAWVAAAVEPHFAVLTLRSTRFADGPHADARFWVLVARRRAND